MSRFQSKNPLRTYGSKPLLSGLILLLSALHVTSSSAQTLPDFKSTYYVNAFGVDLGKAKHSFQCQQADCTLISYAKPSGLAALFFNDTSTETIKLKQTDKTLKWLSYHKLGISEKDGHKKEKHVTMKLDEPNNQIVYVEKNRVWPIQPNTFDLMSIAYAIQYFKLNNRSLESIELHVQDNNFQEKLAFKSIDKVDSLTLEFSDKEFKAFQYTLESKKSRIELWLLPNHHYFPSKIRLINKQEDKTITLNLAELPKLL